MGKQSRMPVGIATIAYGLEYNKHAENKNGVFMKVDFSRALTGVTGEVLKSPSDKNKDLTLLEVCTEALLGYGTRENNASLFTLWKKIS